MDYNVTDCVHGTRSLPSYVLDVVKSKTFQRLRNLKQLGELNCAVKMQRFDKSSSNTFWRDRIKISGVSNFVFKTATHCRASHCIGTAILCQKLLETIEKNSQQSINELHKKCVIVSFTVKVQIPEEISFVCTFQLAGLLHDVGHGPFSHLWEGVVHGGPDKDCKSLN